VWLLVGAALVGLYFLRTAGMVFQGAITGLGMFVSLWITFHYVPLLKKILFSCGGVFDLGVSFLLPYFISRVLGITSGTLLVATLSCGLLLTWTLLTKRLGGPISATCKTSALIVRETALAIHRLRKESNGHDLQVGTGRPRRSSDLGGSCQCPEGQESSSGCDRTVHILALPPDQYQVQ
jgi:hypothetical protein